MTNKHIKWAVYLVFFMVYLFPNGLVFGTFNAVHNHIFAAILAGIYLIPTLKTKKIKKNTLILWAILIIIALYTKRFGVIDMIILPVIDEFINHKEEIKKILSKSPIVILSIVFTFIYSYIYSKLGLGGRGEGAIGSGMLFTAIGEINLTGISIFCLALISRKNNKTIGNILLLLGILTVSRSYLVALVCIIFFNFKIIKKIVSKMIDKLNYFNLTILSSMAFIALGVIGISMYLNGGIATHNTTAGFNRLLVFNDYSNYFRFLAIYLVAKILLSNPLNAFLGVSDEQYLEYGYEICNAKGVPFYGIGPHNIFFSHLKMYGIAVFFEIYYISKHLKKIITVNNFGIYMAIFLYCIILGTGLNNYWLFLSIMTFILYE